MTSYSALDNWNQVIVNALSSECRFGGNVGVCTKRIFSFRLVNKDCNNTKPYPAGSRKTSTGEKTETFCRRSVFSHWLRRQETDPFLLGTVKASQYEDAWYGLRGHS